MKHPKATGIATAIVLTIIVVLAAVLPGTPETTVVEGRDYERLGADLEPFRSAFNAASGHVRAVLLVGPT